MITITYTKPHQTAQKNVWLIGWSKSSFERIKCNTFHWGTYEGAVEKIASIPGTKYLKR